MAASAPHPDLKFKPNTDCLYSIHHHVFFVQITEKSSERKKKNKEFRGEIKKYLRTIVTVIRKNVIIIRYCY